VPRLIERCEEINLTGILLVLVNANIAGLKRYENTRKMKAFAIKGIMVLKRERESIGSGFDQMAAKYFDLASRFCLNGKTQDLEEAMNKELGIDILNIVKKLDPFSNAIKE